MSMKKFARKLGNSSDECEIEGCNRGDLGLIELLVFDPIDHEDQELWLCPDHTVWAQERNEIVEETRDELRKARKRIGQENYESVRKWARPNDGKLPHKVAMGQVDTLEQAGLEPLDESDTALPDGDTE